MKSQQQSQRSLPPMEVRNSNHGESSVRNTNHGAESVSETNQTGRQAAEILAAAIFSAALDAAGITRDEAAFLMGRVTRSMVDQMCSKTVPKAPSLIQLLMLPPSFHIALIQELDTHFGLGRAVLARVQQTLGTLSLLVR